MLSTEAVATLRCNSLSHSSVVLEIFHKQRHQGDLVLFSSFVAHTLSPLWESLEIITKIKYIVKISFACTLTLLRLVELICYCF